jgi:acetate kinase
LIRSDACQGLSHLGINIDPEKNNQKSNKSFEIQKRGNRVKILVVPTNEELEIAQQTLKCIQNLL